MYSEQLTLRAQCRHPSGEVAEITHAELEQSVIDRFARMVAAYPDKPAIVDLSQTMTYAELDHASNRIARTLQQRGGQVNQPVALLMENGTKKLAAIYGVTKAGMCHVVLPPGTPDERLHFILRDLGNPVLLTDASYQQAAASLAADTADLVAIEEAMQNASGDPLGMEITPDTPYRIRYTSGSTGRPKGVLDTHNELLPNKRNSIEELQLCSQDRFTDHSNHYGYAVEATLVGATFYEFNLRRLGLAETLEHLARQAITVMRNTVTTFRQLVGDAAGHLTFPAMRAIILSGEAATPTDILAAQGVFSPRCVFINRYGSTESLTVTSYYVSVESARKLDSLPAGYPRPDVEVMLWDEMEKPVGAGEIGEIVVGSRYLTQGYWNRPELMSERFRDDPDGRDRRIYRTGDLGRQDPDGCLHYLGRKDQQVKIRGHRIEIPEVEAELMALDGVKIAAVDARPGPNGDLRLVAYVVPARDGLVVSALRQSLAQRLPLAMVPAAFVFLKELPLTTSQKVDRRALPAPGRERPPLAVSYTAPRTPVEAELAQIWADVLGLDAVGINDNFLDLGGDSLLASQVVTRTIDVLGIDLPLAALFNAPTVADMALAVTVALVNDSATSQSEAHFNV